MSKIHFINVSGQYRYNKESILTAYINEVYLAQDGSNALHGFAAASRYFFGRPLNELNIDEQALLVGMVKGPSLYNPRRNPERAKQRRNVVLSLLVEQGLLKPNDAAVLKKQPLRLANKGRSRSIFGDYLDLVSLQLERDFDQATLSTENLRIYTGLDVRAQRAAMSAMQDQVARLTRERSNLKGLQGAMVVTDRHSGKVRAVVGSADEYYSGFNRALGAVRPIGSLAKPPIYLTAIASGRFTWWDRIQDEPKRFKVGNDIWEPQNYSRKSHGEVPLYMALVSRISSSSDRATESG